MKKHKPSSPVAFVRLDAALDYFERLIEPKIRATSAHSVTVSYLQSGLGNRSKYKFYFLKRGMEETFVDAVAQRAVEGV